jgi:succinate dehydrogenase / fumarate reductase membrane anchor subunit
MRAWLLQRLSALYLLGFIVWLIVYLVTRPAPWDSASWRAFVRSPAASVAILVLFAALLLHAWVGVRDVVIDYVKPPTTRLAVLGLVAVGELAVAAWVLVILLATP